MYQIVIIIFCLTGLSWKNYKFLRDSGSDRSSFGLLSWYANDIAHYFWNHNALIIRNNFMQSCNCDLFPKFLWVVPIVKIFFGEKCEISCSFWAKNKSWIVFRLHVEIIFQIFTHGYQKKKKLGKTCLLLNKLKNNY